MKDIPEDKSFIFMPWDIYMKVWREEKIRLVVHNIDKGPTEFSKWIEDIL